MTWCPWPRSRAADGDAFHRRGEGAPVLLLHGVGLRAESWGAQIDHLARTCAVYALDLPGHGDSAPLARSDPRLADFTDRVARVLEAAIRAPALIAGHSMGALIALDLAIRYPDRCRAVAALNAVYRRSHEAREAVLERAAALGRGDAQDLAAAPVARWFGSDPGDPARDAARACREWLLGADRDGYAAAYRVFAASDGPADAHLAALSMPTLFLTGSEDANSTPAMSRHMATLVPSGRAVTVAGAGHMTQMTHPREVNAALDGLLERARSGAPDPAGTGRGET